MQITPERLNGDGTEVVVLRADVFDRMQDEVNDDTLYTTAEMLDQVMAEDDANDPYLAELQKKYGGRTY
jgi:hypothetical protein